MRVKNGQFCVKKIRLFRNHNRGLSVNKETPAPIYNCDCRVNICKRNLLSGYAPYPRISSFVQRDNIHRDDRQFTRLQALIMVGGALDFIRAIYSPVCNSDPLSDPCWTPDVSSRTQEHGHQDTRTSLEPMATIDVNNSSEGNVAIYGRIMVIQI